MGRGSHFRVPYGIKSEEGQMKLIKIVKLARVPYGELDEGEEFYFMEMGTPSVVSEPMRSGDWDSIIMGKHVVCPLDTTKYAPEVTYTIEQLDGHEVEDGVAISIDGLQIMFGGAHLLVDKSEIETRYV